MNKGIVRSKGRRRGEGGGVDSWINKLPVTGRNVCSSDRREVVQQVIPGQRWPQTRNIQESSGVERGLPGQTSRPRIGDTLVEH